MQGDVRTCRRRQPATRPAGLLTFLPTKLMPKLTRQLLHLLLLGQQGWMWTLPMRWHIHKGGHSSGGEATPALGRSREPDAYVHVDACPGSLESGTAHMAR